MFDPWVGLLCLNLNHMTMRTALVSETLSRKVCQGSVLYQIEGEPAMMMGFDSVVTKLGFWKAPLQLSFLLSPRKMGWLTLMVKERGHRWPLGRKRKTSNEAIWGELKAILCLFKRVIYTEYRLIYECMLHAPI